MIDAGDTASVQAPSFLPEGFAALDGFASWALDDEAARYAKRIQTPYQDILVFYEAMKPLLEPALQLVDRYKIGAMPPEAVRLYLMVLSMMEVGIAVEIFRASDVPAAVPADRIKIHVPEYQASPDRRSDPHS